jgi:hypothetical protein
MAIFGVYTVFVWPIIGLLSGIYSAGKIVNSIKMDSLGL